MLTDCLEVNAYISGIDNLQIERSAERLKIQFTLLTDYGEEEVTAEV